MAMSRQLAAIRGGIEACESSLRLINDGRLTAPARSCLQVPNGAFGPIHAALSSDVAVCREGFKVDVYAGVRSTAHCPMRSWEA